MAYHQLCRSDDIRDGQARMFQIGDRDIGLFRVDGQWFALDNICPHAGASLAHGYVEEGAVHCRIHHWRFRLTDGKYLDEARPDCDRQTYPLRTVDDWIEVELPD